MEKIMPRRRFQSGRVYLRGTRWVGSYREYEVNPETGKRARRTITFDAPVTSERAAKAPSNHTWTITTPGPKRTSNPQHPEAEKHSEHFSRSGLTKYFPTESREVPVQPCHTFGPTFARTLVSFPCKR